MHTRMKKLTQLMEQFNLPAIVLNPGSMLTYLTGLNFHLMERPTVLLISDKGELALVLPELESGKLADVTLDISAYAYGDNPQERPAAFKRAAEHLQLPGEVLGVEPTRMRFLEMMYLQDALPGKTFADASNCLAGLRICKDETEIDHMRKAAVIAQNALLATLQKMHAGITEKEVANQLIIELLSVGSGSELPFAPIVAFGENSANPHSTPTERPLKLGDLVLFDWGASWEGYFSDITRTFTFGEVDSELVKIGELVLQANAAGRKAGQPGLEIGAVDRAARKVISDGGYGEAFTHRTGHGLGMEAHEEPYVYGANPLTLEVGMVYTVEPGIYLAGKGGVRIEDDMVVTETGTDSLTDLPREVLPLEHFMRG